MVELSEFIDDYMAAYGASDLEPKPTARAIAVAYADHTLPEPCTEAEFRAEVERLTPEVERYL